MEESPGERPGQALWQQVLLLCAVTLAIVTALYSALVALMLWDFAAPTICQANAICRLSPVTMPRERFEVAMVIGWNSLLVGGLWWSVHWAVNRARQGATAGLGIQALRVSSNIGRWMFLGASAASLFVPFLFVVLWAGILVLSALATVPTILYLVWKSL